MKLTIERTHCKGTRFDVLADCPMHRALRQQYPELGVRKVFDGYFEAKDNTQYTFDPASYTRQLCRDLANRVIDHIQIEFK
jgi:hypothetical protein